MGRPPKSNIAPGLQKLLRQVGANLQTLREAKEWSQAELARRSKVSTTTINEIETRRFRDVRLSTLVSLADALDCPVLHILRASDVKLRSSDQHRLLKASEDILRIARKTTDQD